MVYTAAAAIKAAEGEIGYRESGTNQTKYNRWLGTIGGTYGYAWCASFQSWVAARAGGRANIDYPKTAGCLAAVSWFKGHGRWSSAPHIGDWVLYGPGGGTHVELVVAVSSSSITTIGGNTSGSLSGRYFNGDGVYRKTVPRDSDRIYGYGRPKYQEDDMPLSDNDAETLWQTDGIVDNPVTDPKNPKVRPAWLLTDTNQRLRRVETLLTGLAQQAPDVDEEAVAAAVLAQLTPERIVAAIPADLADQVLAKLGERLTPKEGS